MKLHEAIHLFKNLKTETTNKSEITIYDQFIDILNKLEIRTFSDSDIQSIESFLDRLDLESNPRNRKKHFKKALNKFEEFLKETFSLTTKNYYTNLGMGVGVSFGVLFGIIFLSKLERSLGIAFGLIAGMFIGLMIGKFMDKKAMTENNIL
ncbi:hypothetical protein [Wenyingzhuangia marina]|uniref:Glycine zipper n=1 Tax=Wenyingzhuangia marina TaxID=1195760 RepID=A0A1M5V701_9FLAO|nr:hypothetical protein [Wenyingzhuangia marina]GGF74018.1 hypothetical protein GCM10011397_16210 [Wenyingzhuangia marina]SHH70918.1 hypothetical protein SAMN05444281_1557 [Wenyingzhuangia marina]